MSQVRYLWRQLTLEQREELLRWRKDTKRPWHSPPHQPSFGREHFHISAACYEHVPHIGHSKERMDSFTATLLSVLGINAERIVAWCVLPNHYHALVQTQNVLGLLYELGRFHGRSAYAWNKEEGSRGRQVFYRATERAMRSERHFFATVNYIHHNPVHHGYVDRWTEWVWSSASDYLTVTGRAEVERIWRGYPILRYGEKWDPAEM